MTDEDRAALRAEADEVTESALRHPLAGLGVDDDRLDAFGRWVRSFIGDVLIEGFERGFAAALERGRGDGDARKP